MAQAAGDHSDGDGAPLFIVGCVRSGTTLMRNLLRRQEGLICPEETHFYRWGEPFRTVPSMMPLRNNPLLRRHRMLDGIDDETWTEILDTSRSRAEMQRRYVAAFAAGKGISQYRWFDKTPQNIYGVNLISQEFPDAVFLHLVRNPLNVVASLKLGKVVKVEDIAGACNYWREAVLIMRAFRAGAEDRVLELRYEDLTADVPGSMARVFALMDFRHDAGLYSVKDARPERDQHREILTEEDRAIVRDMCGALAAEYGYRLD